MKQVNLKTICVLGLGHIGLPTALLLQNKEYSVVGVDVNEKTVNMINRGETPFTEPGLANLLKHKNITAKTKVENADVFIIAVPTPLNRSLNVADLKYVKSATDMIYPHLKRGNLVILESTVPPKTGENIVIPLLEKSGLKIGEFYFAHCPERAIPGRTIYEMINNDRVIGGFDKTSTDLAHKVYSSFVLGEIHLVDMKTAEFIKLIENTYRDVNIALANELAQIAEEFGIDVWEGIEIANKHPRVNIHSPGPGVGGHCVALDPWFLIENSTKGKIISMAREINDSMPNYVLELLKTIIDPLTEDSTITIFGVAYKGDQSDIRESPAIKLIEMAHNLGIKIRCYDPYVEDFQFELFCLDEAVKDSDCIVVIADHKCFKDISPQKLGKMMREKNLLDTRNILCHEKWKEAGFKVKCL
ncbi:unnamed protein product [marine sediment metagenome]|uniref:UDP-glucose/GDP-mannose dehydrogenase C-terminal domain-containing protein n=1 Tax=marine sediment metagenome TaxID=412755 RepID=X1T7F8_9ZZZZ